MPYSIGVSSGRACRRRVGSSRFRPAKSRLRRLILCRPFATTGRCTSARSAGHGLRSARCPYTRVRCLTPARQSNGSRSGTRPWPRTWRDVRTSRSCCSASSCNSAHGQRCTLPRAPNFGPGPNAESVVRLAVARRLGSVSFCAQRVFLDSRRAHDDVDETSRRYRVACSVGRPRSWAGQVVRRDRVEEGWRRNSCRACRSGQVQEPVA